MMKIQFYASRVGLGWLLCMVLVIPFVHADYDDDTSLDYTWTAASGPVDHYNIYLSIDGGDFTLIGQTPDATPSFTYTNAEDGKTYQIKVQAVDAIGSVGPESDPSDPTTVSLSFDIYLSEGWNLISFPIARCYYQGTPPTAPMPDGIEYLNIADLGYTSMAEWFTDHLTPNNPIPSQSAWLQVKGFDQTGAHVLDSTIPSTFHTLKYMAGGYGYWIKMETGTGGGVFSISGPRLAETSVLTLQPGWNLIGHIPLQGFYDTDTPPPDEALYTRNIQWVKTPSSLADYLLTPIQGQLDYLRTTYPGGKAAVFDPSIPPQFATLRYMAPGNGYEIRMGQPSTFTFCPTSNAAPTLDPTTVDINAPSFATNRTAFLYGSATWDGKPAPEGTSILVYTQDGRLVGKGTVHASGLYGALAIYGDDLTTPQKDGATEGEWLSLSLNGIPLPQPVRWEEHRMIELNLQAKSAPQRNWLGQNYPNPFNPETWIPFALAQDAPVQVRIYDVTGHLVRTLDLGYRQAGWYETRSRAAYWDGRNTLGEKVASGVYLYQLMTPTENHIKQLVILK